MAIKIFKTSAKHYNEKKHLRFAPKATVQRIYILNYPCASPGGLLDLFGTEVKCKNNFWWRINRFSNLQQLPAGYVDFVKKNLVNDWGLDINIQHDFDVMKRIFINSIINN